jgi:hypothetical protein
VVGGLWSVRCDDAIEIWAQTPDRTYDQLVEMKIGMMHWELYGPPAPDAFYGKNHFRSKGPLGTDVFYQRFDPSDDSEPGLIIVLGIG